MKRVFSVAAFVVTCLLAACNHLDVAAEGNPDRVLNGTVRPPVTLPAGAEIVVQLLDPSRSLVTNPLAGDLPVANRAPVPAAPRHVGEFRQTLAAPAIEPVPFRIEYHATDEELRHGFNVDVRVSIGGRVRFRTINAYMITLASSPFPQEVPVQPLE